MQSDAEFLRRARQSYRSSFGSVRVDVAALTRRDLRSRHVLWLHGWAMGLLTLGVMWLTTALLRWAGVDTLALRYALTLGMGYLCYLALVRVWAGMLIRREAPDIPDLVVVSQHIVPVESKASDGRAMLGGRVWPMEVVVVHPGLQFPCSMV